MRRTFAIALFGIAAMLAFDALHRLCDVGGLIGLIVGLVLIFAVTMGVISGAREARKP